MHGRALLLAQCEAIPPFHLMPRASLEARCNAVLRGLVGSLLPLFVNQLASDYQRWAGDAAYRAHRLLLPCRPPISSVMHASTPPRPPPPPPPPRAGYGFAEAFARAGAVVYATARKPERMKGLEAQGCRLLQLDVTEDASVDNTVLQICQECGRIDVLVGGQGSRLLAPGSTAPPACCLEPQQQQCHLGGHTQ